MLRNIALRQRGGRDPRPENLVISRRAGCKGRADRVEIRFSRELADTLIKKEELGRVSLYLDEDNKKARLVPGGVGSHVAVQAGLGWYIRFTVSKYDMSLFIGSRKEHIPRYTILDDGSVEFDLIANDTVRAK